MEASQPLPAATTAAPNRSRRLLLLPLLLFLLPARDLRAWEAEERPRTREEECHFYAGGQVYPGEASRVSVADHSPHLSKAKSRWFPVRGGLTRGRVRREVGRAGRHVGLAKGPPGSLAWAASPALPPVPGRTWLFWAGKGPSVRKGWFPLIRFWK